MWGETVAQDLKPTVHTLPIAFSRAWTEDLLYEASLCYLGARRDGGPLLRQQRLQQPPGLGDLHDGDARRSVDGAHRRQPDLRQRVDEHDGRGSWILRDVDRQRITGRPA